MTSYKVRTSAAVLLGFILSAPCAFADKKDDLYSKGNAAVANGDAIGAKAAFCQLAGDDPEYKDAKTQCADYTARATAQLNRFKLNFAEGDALMKDGKLAEAEFKFKNVKAGDYAEIAKQRLAEIAKLKDKAAVDAVTARQNADAEAQMKTKLDQGVEAFNRNDFSAAKALLSAVSGKYQADAQGYLGKIRTFESKMTEAAQDAANHNYTAASVAYSDAARIAPNGPGDPITLAGKMTAAAAAATQAAALPVVTASTNPPLVVKKPEPKLIDVNTYNQEGKKAMAKGDFKKAKRFFQEVLAQDVHNQEANDSIAEINSKDTSKALATDADPQLSKYIGLFYDGSYIEVESLLNTYIYSQTKGKLGLANFYAGASMLTRYFLGGGTDENLRREARKKFKAAREVDGFKPPEKFVSPKIMKVYEAS